MEPTHCPSCMKLVVGETRSFCRACGEFFDETDNRWMSTVERSVIDLDHCWTH